MYQNKIEIYLLQVHSMVGIPSNNIEGVVNKPPPPAIESLVKQKMLQRIK